jgi:hypothetical protein
MVDSIMAISVNDHCKAICFLASPGRVVALPFGFSQGEPADGAPDGFWDFIVGCLVGGDEGLTGLA